MKIGTVHQKVNLKGIPVREILYKRKQSLKTRKKVISLREKAEDKDCKTIVNKHFVYIVSRVDSMEEQLASPDVFIKKSILTKSKTEKFSFRVKGSFYLNKDRMIYLVGFCHSLKILIEWKQKDFSPKKSVTMT